LTPLCSTTQQRRHELWLGAPQLRSEQLLEEMVVAIGLLVSVQRHQEQVGARQQLQDRRRAARVEDRVAERPGHVLENSGPSQEAKIVGGEVREQLGLQVVGYEMVASRKRGDAFGLRPPSPDRQ